MIGHDYILWLFERYGTRGYERVFGILSRRVFTWQNSFDENRAFGGLSLRRQCAYESGVYESDIADGPCSCLEMLCALSDRMFEMCGQESPKHFLEEMLLNLGISKNTSEDSINYILDRWLSQNYEANGKGSIFYFRSKITGRDVRDMDIWSQMNLYLNIFYPLDERFL